MRKESLHVRATDMVLWSRLTYPRRLFLWLLGYSLLLVGCFIVFQYHREKEFKSEELNIRLQSINSEILNGLKSDIPGYAPVYPFTDLRVSIIDTCGRMVYDNMSGTAASVNHLDREEIAEAIASGSGYSVRRLSETTGETYFYSATRGDNGYIVRTAVPYTVSLSELLDADLEFIWIMGGITLIMCVLGYYATRRVGLHIVRLNSFAEKAERGERIYDTTPFPHDELGSISSHIVRLYANLQQAVADRDREHRAALHEQNEKERIKKQLTNNINHELKTPVASIKVCIETLILHEDLDKEKRAEFLQRCMLNAERLEHLLTDVSLITRMDDAPASIAREQLNLTDIISETVNDSADIAAKRGISIYSDISRPLPIMGNQSLLASVFRNLIDNAILYSGGSRIELHLLSSGPDEMVITVEDNGSGVPSEHLPHLFERFYRIDKGRSRAAGGTGLGLSIVLNAVLLHNGCITVDNKPSGGLIFTMRFKIA